MGKTVLWTDDSKFVRSAGKLMLDQLGLRLREAANGAEALLALDEWDDIDAVVLDLNMPVMDGCEFLRQLRDRADLPKPPVILCTTEADMPMIAEAMRAGCAEYINKPCKLDDLRDKLIAVGILDRAGFVVGESVASGAAS